MEQKLTGWKASSLSLVGRVTLAQSVLSAIPSFIMQTSVLPSHIYSEIDKKIRNFVWGTTDETRKAHLISWEAICIPKSKGGLGLRSARQLNQAYMMKLGFLFLAKPEELWVQVLQTKYFKDEEEDLVLQIAGLSPPAAHRGYEATSWGLEKDGRFRIRSAYDLLGEHEGRRRDVDWELVWRWKGPIGSNISYGWWHMTDFLRTRSGRSGRGRRTDHVRDVDILRRQSCMCCETVPPR
ncbi:Putative ribonuclease H protein At1g65750 [Linum perenne]